MTTKQIEKLAERLCKINVDIMNGITGKEFLEHIWNNDRGTANAIIDFSVGIVAEVVELNPESKNKIIKFIETKEQS